jgi:myo-inositol-1(or 4)-monophosphatase
MMVRDLLEEVIEIVKNAGEILKSFYEKEIQIYEKEGIELVTQADFEVQRKLKAELLKLKKDFDFIGEEELRENRIKELLEKESFFWLVDPLDGTLNFIHKLPWFAISVALMKGRTPILGVVYNPVSGECFFAERNKGAYIENGNTIKKMEVSSTERFEEALLCTSFPGKCKLIGFEKCLELFKEFNLLTRGVRRFGASALDLAYVAWGKYDGFWEPFLKPWDTSAGILLIKEAGGEVTDFWGNPYHPFLETLVASNKKIHNYLIKITSKWNF